MRKAQPDFLAAGGPAMINAQTQLNSIFGAADFWQDEAAKAAKTLEGIEKEFGTAQERVKKNLDTLPKSSATTAVRNTSSTISEINDVATAIAFAIGEQGAASEVLTASSALRREADVLRAEIDAFLSNIGAA